MPCGCAQAAQYDRPRRAIGTDHPYLCLSTAEFDWDSSSSDTNVEELSCSFSLVYDVLTSGHTRNMARGVASSHLSTEDSGQERRREAISHYYM